MYNQIKSCHLEVEVISRSGNGNTKTELMECAIALFEEHGYDNVTIKQICSTYGISKTAFYFHYKTKEDLIIGFFGNVNSDIEQNMAMILKGETAVSQLWLLTEQYVKRSVETGVNVSREVFKVYLSNRQSPLLPENIYLREAMINLVERAQKNNEIANQSDILLLYETLIYLMDGAGYAWVMAEGAFDLIEKSKSAFICLLQPLAAI